MSIIKWNDAFEILEFKSIKELKEESDKLVITTTGKIILETKYAVYISNEKQGRRYRGITVIPKSLIIEIIE